MGPTDLAHGLLRSFNEMDCDLLAQILHQDAEHGALGHNFDTRIRGRDGIVSYFRDRVFPKFTRVTFTPVTIYEDARQNAVIIEWKSAIAPRNGPAYSNDGVFVLRLNDGRIGSITEYFDTEKVRKNVR